MPPLRRSHAPTLEVIVSLVGCSPRAASHWQRPFTLQSLCCRSTPVPLPTKGLFIPGVHVLQPAHHSPLAARFYDAVTAGVPQSRYQSRDYWSLQPLCRSLTTAASLQRSYVAATGCSNAPVPSPIKGLLEPVVLVPQPVCYTPSVALAMLQSLCCSSTPAGGFMPPLVFMLHVQCALRRALCCLSCCSACTCAPPSAPCAPRSVLVVGPVVCVTREDHPPPLTQAGSALNHPAPHDD